MAFTAPRPHDWTALCWLAHEAKERALLQGIVKVSVSRLDWSDKVFHGPTTGFNRWFHKGPKPITRRPIPEGHIAVLVEGTAEKE